METTYKKIVEINDVFNKIAAMPMPMEDAHCFMKAILELETKYADIDSYASEINESYKMEDSDKANAKINEFLETKTNLESFPIYVCDANFLVLSPIDLIRVKDFIKLKPL